MTTEEPQHYFTHENGLFTLERLFKNRRHGRYAKFLIRVVEKGEVRFYLCEEYNPKTGYRAGWRLRDKDTILEAIRLAEVHKLKTYGRRK